MIAAGATSGGKVDPNGKPLYVIELNAQDYTDGAVTAQAVVYPVSGVPLVLPDLPLLANYGGATATTIKWIDSVNGSDTAPGDGSQANPYQTVDKAEQVIGANGNNSFVYCKAGSYAYATGTASNDPAPAVTTTSTGTLTVMAAPGVAASDVVFTGFSAFNLPATAHRRFKGVTINNVEIGYGGNSATVVFEECIHTGTSWLVQISGGNFGGGVWFLNPYCHDTQNAIPSASVVLNAYCTDQNEDAFRPGLAVNCVAVRTQPVYDPENPQHSDIVQWGSDVQNVLVYGLLTDSGTASNSQSWGNESGGFRDIFIRDMNCPISGEANGNAQVYGTGRNIYVVDSTFGNTIYLNTTDGTNPFTASKCVFENVDAVIDPTPLSGVTIR